NDRCAFRPLWWPGYAGLTLPLGFRRRRVRSHVSNDMSPDPDASSASPQAGPGASIFDAVRKAFEHGHSPEPATPSTGPPQRRATTPSGTALGSRPGGAGVDRNPG